MATKKQPPPAQSAHVDKSGPTEPSDEELNRIEDEIEEASAESPRDFEEEVETVRTGYQEPGWGPSDSSDSASDMPRSAPDTDSDRNNTGERASVENVEDDLSPDDLLPDSIVSEGEAGLAHTPPDPERNGGKPDDIDRRKDDEDSRS